MASSLGFVRSRPRRIRGSYAGEVSRQVTFSTQVVVVDALQEYSWRDVTRFSLSSLAAHGNQLTPDTSKVLLQEVSIRLAAQHKTLQALVDSLDHKQQSKTSSEMPSTSSKDYQGDKWTCQDVKASIAAVAIQHKQ
jgi:hypothetical protein